MKRVNTHIENHLHSFAKSNKLVFKDILEEGIKQKMSIEYEERQLINKLKSINEESDKIMKRLSDIEKIKEEVDDVYQYKTLETILKTVENIYHNSGSVQRYSIEFWAEELNMTIEEITFKIKERFPKIDIGDRPLDEKIKHHSSPL